MKYLGVLIHSHLSWKFHVDYVASKLSRIKVINLVRLLESFPAWDILFRLTLYSAQSVMFLCLTYGLIAWDQSVQTYMNKLIPLQNMANALWPFLSLELMLFSSKILPVNMLKFETASTLMYGIFNNSAPQNICRSFRRTSLI